MASNPNQYRIANDEYVTDFSYLNPTQAGCLFKLRTAYFFSRSPLSAEQVAYLCPAVTEQDQQARDFVLSKFFTFSEGFWHSELMEEKIYLAKQEQEILEAEEKAREIRSLKARQSINARWNKKLVGNANNPIPKIAANTSKNTIEDTIVHTNVDTNAIRPNIRSYKENDTNVYTNVSNPPKNTIEDTIVHTNVDTNAIRPNIRSYKENDTNVYTNVSNPPKNTIEDTIVHTNVDTNAIRPNIRSYKENDTNVYTNVSNPPKNTIEDTIVHTNVDTNAIRPNIRSYKENDTNVYTNVSADSNQSSETTEPQEVSGDSKNSEKTVQSASHAYAHARTDPISDIRSVCINNLINNKQHRSVSVSVSGSDLENTVRDLFNRENTPWTVDEVLQTMIFFGLDAKSLDRWRKRSQENESAVAELAQTGMAAFDFDTVSQVFARCQQAKDKEGKPLSSAIAFVIKSLQRELTAIRNRKLAAKAAKPEDEAEPAETQDPYDVSGMIRNPNGSYRFGPKRSSYADRDYTAGLIQNPDGTYRIAPRPRKS
ncbi:DUF1376 domain-containing protein [Turicimonas muris]|uniref:DUF1376 domain-containing protein n=1 Tax=Turicimonas muris TaxID=1796652 RepID=UPI003F677B8D